MLSCHDAREQMVPFVLDEAEEAGAAQINDHLAGCAACRQQERLLLALIESVRRETAVPGNALRARIRRAVTSQGRAAPPSRSALSRAALTLRRPVPAWLLAAACLAGAVVAHRLLPVTLGTRGEEPIGRVVTSGRPPRFVVASPYETALDVRPIPPATALPPADGPGIIRAPGADSL